MEDSKRLIVGFILIFLIMIIFQFYTISRRKESMEQGKEVVELKEEEVEKKELSKDEIPQKVVTDEMKLEEIFRKSDTTLTEEEIKEIVGVETNLLNVFLNPTGGTIDSIYLKDYGVKFLPLNKINNLSSTEIIKGNARYPTVMIPFSFKIEDLEREKRVIFSYLQDSLEIKKTYIFKDNSYLIDIECHPRAEYLHILSCFDTGEEFPREAQYSGVVYSIGKKVQNIRKGNLFKGEDRDISGTIDWCGYKTKYFFIGIVPDDYITEFTINKSPDNPSLSLRSGPNTTLYFGPLKYPLLAEAKKGLEDAIYFGWGFIRPISKVIYNFLNFLHRYLKNYGLVIIIFAIVMILLLSPITMSSFRSMSRMQDLQPKMQAIREKYKDDPQRMNKEIMQLYREFGINPFSSCLPLFLQFPIFFALYSVLNSSIELKGAPFIMWIKDLSMKDPYYILPILMGVSMFMQQRLLSPKQGSDQQRIFSYLMPIILTFIFLSFPSGLVLYWLTYNILMIVVQWYIRKQG